MASECDNILPMREWIAQDTGKESCRPCMLPPMVSWYESELEEQGRGDLAGKIKKTRMAKDTSPEKVAGALDFVKTQVQGSLLDRLKEFDCSCQLNEPEE